MTLHFNELEQVYEYLAVTLDGIENSQRNLFLAKLSLALARETSSLDIALDAIERCARGLNPIEDVMG